MKQSEYMNFKFSQLQLFITAVESETLTAASERLHVTQPYVTKMIQQMEEQLGVILFTRRHRKLELTPAGRELYIQWRNIVAFYSHSIETANTIQEGKLNRLVIGVGELATVESLLRFAEKIRPVSDRIEIQYEYHSMSEQWRLLREDKVDGILTSGHTMTGELDDGGYCWKIFEKSCLAVYVPDTNPLYERDSITFSDLKAENFIALDAQTDYEYVSLLNQLCNEAGFAPRISCYVPNEMSFKINLMLGKGIVLADSETDLENEHIRRFILSEYRNDVIFVMKAEDHNKMQKALFSLL